MPFKREREREREIERERGRGRGRERERERERKRERELSEEFHSLLKGLGRNRALFQASGQRLKDPGRDGEMEKGSRRKRERGREMEGLKGAGPVIKSERQQKKKRERKSREKKKGPCPATTALWCGSFVCSVFTRSRETPRGPPRRLTPDVSQGPARRACKC